MFQRIKNQFWLRTLKWHLYKKRTGQPYWKASYLFEAAVRKLKPGDVVIDCGANIGTITTRVALTGATVHAFEPDDYSFGRLRAATRGLENVILHNAAVGADSGRVRLYRVADFDRDPELNSLSSSVFSDKKNVSDATYTEVEQVDIVDFVRNIGGPVRILKLDVEGAEVPILERLIDSGMLEKIDAVFAETHERKIPQLAERTSKLKRRVEQDFSPRINLDWI